MNNNLIILILFCVIGCSCKGASKKTNNQDIYSAQIEFKDSVYDFNMLKQSEIFYSHSFSFINTGTVPAVILHATPSCKCTSVSYNKTPVAVGGKDSITVFFDSVESGKGYFNKNIKIRINSSQIYTLTIRGNVK